MGRKSLRGRKKETRVLLPFVTSFRMFFRHLDLLHIDHWITRSIWWMKMQHLLDISNIVSLLTNWKWYSNMLMICWQGLDKA